MSQILPFPIGKLEHGENFIWDPSISKIGTIKKFGDISFIRLSSDRIKLTLGLEVENIEVSGDSYIKAGLIHSKKNLKISLDGIQVDGNILLDFSKNTVKVNQFRVVRFWGLSIRRGFGGWLVRTFYIRQINDMIQSRIQALIEEHIPLTRHLDPDLMKCLLL